MSGQTEAYLCLVLTGKRHNDAQHVLGQQDYGSAQRQGYCYVLLGAVVVPDLRCGLR